MKNDINLLTFLFQINTSPDATDSSGWSALMYASFYGYHRAVSILLQKNANPDFHKTKNDVTPLLMAAQNSHSIFYSKRTLIPIIRQLMD